jgi:formylglycine-generating enzyme required for sulfatase activity
MVWIPGGTFRMGSDRHYPEEAPVHRVTVSGFWIDRTPVSNRQFKEFVCHYLAKQRISFCLQLVSVVATLRLRLAVS